MCTHSGLHYDGPSTEWIRFHKALQTGSDGSREDPYLRDEGYGSVMLLTLHNTSPLTFRSGHVAQLQVMESAFNFQLGNPISKRSETARKHIHKTTKQSYPSKTFENNFIGEVSLSVVARSPEVKDT